MKCKCQSCRRTFETDVYVKDDIWEVIKPDGKAKGAGLLCVHCIIQRIESRVGNFAFVLVEVDEYKSLTKA